MHSTDSEGALQSLLLAASLAAASVLLAEFKHALKSLLLTVRADLWLGARENKTLGFSLVAQSA